MVSWDLNFFSLFFYRELLCFQNFWSLILCRILLHFVIIAVECCGFSLLFWAMFLFHYRELLWKFFYPADYQDMVPTEEAKPGEYRNYKKFEFMINLMQTSTIDILFTKDSVRLESSYISFRTQKKKEFNIILLLRKMEFVDDTSYLYYTCTVYCP